MQKGGLREELSGKQRKSPQGIKWSRILRFGNSWIKAIVRREGPAILKEDQSEKSPREKRPMFESRVVTYSAKTLAVLTYQTPPPTSPRF